MNTTYELQAVAKSYQRGRAAAVHALCDLSLTIHDGDFVAIEGSSGSGKSTLLHLLGALDKPTSGTLKFETLDLALMNDATLTDLRLHAMGFIFQQFNLIPTLTAQENVEVALVPAGIGRHHQRERARLVLSQVGLEDRAEHLPSQMSGGEQQRVAIARALVNGPRVVLADEPTGNLDSQTGASIIDMIAALARERGLTVVLVTHDRDIAARASRRLRMRDGKVIE